LLPVEISEVANFGVVSIAMFFGLATPPPRPSSPRPQLLNGSCKFLHYCRGVICR
jgi:hypothetical protein